jgi:hypothetical protein
MKPSSWLTLAGALIVIAGLVGGVWLQLDADRLFGGDAGQLSVSAAYRWQLAMFPLLSVAGGLAVLGIAQILRSMATTRAQSN